MYVLIDYNRATKRKREVFLANTLCARVCVYVRMCMSGKVCGCERVCVHAHVRGVCVCVCACTHVRMFMPIIFMSSGMHMKGRKGKNREK